MLTDLRRHCCFASDIRSRVFQTKLICRYFHELKYSHGELPIPAANSALMGQAKKDGSHGYIDKGDLLLLWKSKAPTVDGHLIWCEGSSTMMWKSWGVL